MLRPVPKESIDDRFQTTPITPGGRLYVWCDPLWSCAQSVVLAWVHVVGRSDSYARDQADECLATIARDQADGALGYAAVPRAGPAGRRSSLMPLRQTPRQPDQAPACTFGTSETVHSCKCRHWSDPIRPAWQFATANSLGKKFRTTRCASKRSPTTFKPLHGRFVRALVRWPAEFSAKCRSLTEGSIQGELT